MKKIIFAICLVTLTISLYAQNGWQNSRHAFIMGAGGNIFMGDLGGGSKSGTHIFALDDVDPHFLKFSGMFGYRYKFSERLAGRANIILSKVAGDDANSKNEQRRIRNLNFRSQLLDVGTTLDYYFVREKELPKMGTASAGSRMAAYFFVGIGFLRFNPQGNIDGQWQDLQPLCTEGQGSGDRFLTTNGGVTQVVEAYPPYKLTAAAIPIGLGLKCQITPNMGVGLELAQRFTTTDYIDDCSVRGNPGYNDSYFTGMLTVYYRFLKSGNSGK